MSILSYLTALLNRLLGWPAAPDPDAYEWDRRAGDERLDVVLYQSDRLTEASGTTPAEVACRFIAAALDRAGIGYRVRVKNVAFEVPPEFEVDNPPNDTLSWWAGVEKPYEGSDCTMLLLDIDGGGLTYLSGRYSISPAGNVTRHVERTDVGDTDLHRNVRACLHELGHALGGRHRDDMLSPPGLYYNDSAVDVFMEYAYGEADETS